jgi:hypothetical protein
MSEAMGLQNQRDQMILKLTLLEKVAKPKYLHQSSI